MTQTSKAKLAADYLLLAVVPAVLGAALKDALTPGDSGDWDDPKKLAKRLAGEEISYLMGLMVGVREFSNAAQAVTGTAKYGTDYAGPAACAWWATSTKLGKQVNQGELDSGFRKALVNVAGERCACRRRRSTARSPASRRCAMARPTTRWRSWRGIRSRALACTCDGVPAL
jgi:hypothetical protein